MVHRLASQSFRHAFSTLLFPDSISACRRCLVFAVCPLCSEAMFIPSFIPFGATFLPIYNIPPNPRKVNKLRLSAEKLEFLRLRFKFLTIRLEFLMLRLEFLLLYQHEKDVFPMSFPVLDDLRKARIHQDVSISELSTSSGISEPTLSKLFSGKQDDARLATLADIAAALGLDIRAIPEGTLDSLNTAKPVDADLYNRLLAEKDKLAAQKDRVIQAQRLYVRVLFCAVVGLAACLAALAFVAFMCG